MPINVIGIDWSADPRNVGIAFGRYFDDQHTDIDMIQEGSSKNLPENTIISLVNDYPNAPTLIALDAPLGWPKTLAEELSGHIAGANFKSHANNLFRRRTDIFIKEIIGKQPLDVGADRIARTAYTALELLHKLRRNFGKIELAWVPEIDGISVIEVYPAATLIAHGIDIAGYKSNDGLDERIRIINDLKKLVNISGDIHNIEKRSDTVDAVACVLAGQDFLAGKAIQPPDGAPVKKEGWIWVRQPTAQTDAPK